MHAGVSARGLRREPAGACRASDIPGHGCVHQPTAGLETGTAFCCSLSLGEEPAQLFKEPRPRILGPGFQIEDEGAHPHVPHL